MPTEKLRIQWLQIEQNGFRIIWKKMVTEELGYVDTEELETKSYRRTQNTMVTDRTKWFQKNLEKMVTEELGYMDTEELEQNSYRRTQNTMVIDLRSKWLQKNWEKLLQKNLKDNGYRRNWNKIVTE